MELQGEFRALRADFANAAEILLRIDRNLTSSRDEMRTLHDAYHDLRTRVERAPTTLRRKASGRADRSEWRNVSKGQQKR